MDGNVARVRALFLPHAYQPAIGGAELLCRRLAIEMARRNHDVSVLTPSFISAEGLFSAGIASVGPPRELDHGVPVARTDLDRPWDRFSSTDRRRQAIQRRLRRAVQIAIDTARPDLIFTLPHHLPNVRAALTSGAANDIPVVWAPHLHEDDPYWPFEELRADLPSAAAVIALTDHEKRRLIDAYGVESHRIFVTGIGIDQCIHPDVVSPGDRDPIVVYVGRLAQSKNLSLLVQTMQLVWKDSTNARLVLAGSEVPGEPDVTSLLAELSPTERSRIDVRRNVEEAEKHDLLRRARCFVSPSVRESFGIVLLEAMVHGTPIVAPDTPVMREVTAGHGMLAPPEPHAFAGAVLPILVDDELASRMGESGLRHVSKQHSWASVTDRFEQACRLATGSAP